MTLRLLTILMAAVLGLTTCFAKNRALLVGIGNYNKQATGWKVIHGNNDIALLTKSLKKEGYSIKSLVDSKATKSNVLSALNTFVRNAEAGDKIYIHFSGHGQLIKDVNKDEQSDFDQSFVCYDACFSPRYKVNGKAYYGQNHLIDDELFPILNRLKSKVGKDGEVMVIFDSCYSGGADRGEEDDPDPDSEVEWVRTTRGSDDEFTINQPTMTYLRSISAPGRYSSGGKITVISACESDQRNYECKDPYSGKQYGSLSYCISKLLSKNIPFSQWEQFFKGKQYMKTKIFRPSQHPVVESYR